MKVKSNSRKTTPKPYSSPQSREDDAIARGGVATPFPWKLHEMLEDAAKEGNEWIVSWQSHGRSFLVHKPKIFVEKIMPTYFNQSKFASFQRQLNLYGFNRLTAGTDKGAYYHEFFIRGQRSLCRGMVRHKIKGTKVRRTLSPEEEPNFYTMTNIPIPEAQHQDHHADDASRDSPSPPPLQLEVARTRGKNMAGKARAMRANLQRQQLSDVLQQTRKSLCDFGDSMNEMEEYLPQRRLSNALSDVPSVSPVESEESDSEDSSSYQFQQQPSYQQEQPHEQQGYQQSKLDSSGETDAGFMQGGDLLFFEGKPFHYMEHLDSVPSVPKTDPAKPNPMQSLYPRQRDTLHSLMRCDPKALIGSTW